MGCRIEFWQPSDLSRETPHDGHMLIASPEFDIAPASDFLRP